VIYNGSTKLVAIFRSGKMRQDVAVFGAYAAARQTGIQWHYLTGSNGIGLSGIT
jgi:hypothetical protein